MKKLTGTYKVQMWKAYSKRTAKVRFTILKYRAARVSVFLFALAVAVLLAPMYAYLIVVNKMSKNEVAAGYTKLWSGVWGTGGF